MALSDVILTRLEKAAIDNGFDREVPRQGEWLAFASTQVPLHIWLTATGDERFVVALSQQKVIRALPDHGLQASPLPLPAGAEGGLATADIPALHGLVRRLFQLSMSLPDELLRRFEKETASLPRTTEAERLVVQRVGQEIFRAGLIEYWEGRCAVTDLAVSALLVASHIKPWASCATDAERLDVFNGFLLAPNLDVAFDRGFITISESGEVVVSNQLTARDRRVLGLDVPLRIRRLDDGHRAYLRSHREQVFKRP